MSQTQTSLAGPASPATGCQIRELLASVDSKVEISKLTDSTPFADAGMDSLDFYNLIIAIEDKFGINIPPGDLTKVNTIEKTLQYLNEGRR